MADSNLDRLRSLESHLRSHLRGQDHLLPRVAAALTRAELGLSVSGRPKSSFLFVGPTGTGKTELALCFSAFLSRPLLRLDLSEYQNQPSVEKLLGTSPTDPGLLGRQLTLHPSGTLLFDELEKAHPLVLDLFLQILDAARITDATGRTHSLESYIIVFTSNVGSAEAMRMERSSQPSVEAATLRRLEQSLRPEFLARIDEKLVFARLSPSIQREICALMVDRELIRLRSLGYDLQSSPEIIDFLVRHGFDPIRGARPLRQAVERHLQQAVVASLFHRGVAAGRLMATNSELQIQAT